MSTPQNPDNGETPQDPSDPQNPYGTPPPPVPPPPNVPPPSDPPPTEPPATPPPAAPAYGDPSVPAPPVVPPAAAPYGQPAYGQPAHPGAPAAPAYGGPGFPQPGVDAPNEPGKGMAITALVLSCLCCLAVPGMILAVIVLVRSRDGRNRGKGLAIAALVIGTLSLIATVAAGVGVAKYVNGLADVNDLGPGDCITANGLTDDNSETIDTIRTVKCSEKHDGEVLATTKVTAELAKDFSKMDPQTTCAPAIEAAGKTALMTEDVNVTALSVTDPKAGDNIACVAYNADGSKLTSKLGS
jgi:hypothetical protein